MGHVGRPTLLNWGRPNGVGCEVLRLIGENRDRPLALITVDRGNSKAYGLVVGGSPVPSDLPREAIEAAAAALSTGRAVEVALADMRIRAEPIRPAPYMVVSSRGPLLRALIGLAGLLGYNVAVIGEQVDGVVAIMELERISELAGDKVFIVANEGGAETDVEVVYRALRGGAPFVGLMASRQRAAVIIAELVRRGLPLELIKERLHTPVGLDIGSRTPEEVALSIMAEVVMFLRGGTGAPLMRVKDPYPLLESALKGELDAGCGRHEAVV